MPEAEIEIKMCPVRYHEQWEQFVFSQSLHFVMVTFRCSDDCGGGFSLHMDRFSVESGWTPELILQECRCIQDALKAIPRDVWRWDGITDTFVSKDGEPIRPEQYDYIPGFSRADDVLRGHAFVITRHGLQTVYTTEEPPCTP